MRRGSVKKGFIFLSFVVVILLFVTSFVSSSSGPSVPVIKGRWESGTFVGDFNGDGIVESFRVVLIVEDQNGSSFTGKTGAIGSPQGYDLETEVYFNITGTIDQYGYITIRIVGLENEPPTVGKYEEGRIKLQEPQYGEVILYRAS
ncbi:hypothetical protein Mc24_02563 [Thermotoga sp. Mc24]|nr:hypothetical protein T2812B_05130 [Thermotoga sp. 2812B]EJX26010.1 hypothetical protein EMP_05766 [Thermotoga sp. EMP]KHC92275.1 hypothetical protein Mc24_02563 [Thermotoga sp. Mc24]